MREMTYTYEGENDFLAFLRPLEIAKHLDWVCARLRRRSRDEFSFRQCVSKENLRCWQGAPYRPEARSSSLFRPRGSPTTKAAAEPAKAPNKDRLTTSPDWNDVN